jgi:hypothetical protein
MSVAWERWVGGVFEAKAIKAQLRNVTMRWMYQCLAKSFDMWTVLKQAHARDLQIMKKVALHWTKQIVSRALEKWHCITIETARYGCILRKISLRWKNRLLLSAFNSVQSYVDASTRSQLAFGDVAKDLLHNHVLMHPFSVLGDAVDLHIDRLKRGMEMAGDEIEITTEKVMPSRLSLARAMMADTFNYKAPESLAREKITLQSVYQAPLPNFDADGPAKLTYSTE